MDPPLSQHPSPIVTIHITNLPNSNLSKNPHAAQPTYVPWADLVSTWLSSIIWLSCSRCFFSLFHGHRSFGCATDTTSLHQPKGFCTCLGPSSLCSQGLTLVQILTHVPLSQEAFLGAHLEQSSVTLS